MTCVINVTISR